MVISATKTEEVVFHAEKSRINRGFGYARDTDGEEAFM